MYSFLVRMDNEKENLLKEKYTELRLIDQQIRQIQKQLQDLENQIIEIMYVQQSLDELKNVKNGTEILVPVSNGIFAKAALKENNDLLVNVGANTVVEKDVDSVKKMLETNINEIKKLEQYFLQELQKLGLQATSIEKEMNSLMSEK